MNMIMEKPVDAYKIGKTVKMNNGVAKITSVNPDGTATLNWAKPPKGSTQKKGGFAGTLPSKTAPHMPSNNNVYTETKESFNTTVDSYNTYEKKEQEEYVLDRQYELYNTEGFPNELNLEKSRIRMHNMLITDHVFVQDPDDIPGGCKNCWNEINITSVE